MLQKWRTVLLEDLAVALLAAGVGGEGVTDVHGEHGLVQRLQLPRLLLGDPVL
jgi:hypothetical protein